METRVIELVERFYEKHNVEEGHGIGHALKVLEHGVRCLEECELTSDQQLAVKLACIQHDNDDRKLFPKSIDCENARNIMREAGVSDTVEEMVVSMIKLVSCAHNGNNTDGIESWMLIPRWSDRLEAMGNIGILRSMQYSKHVGMPVVTINTPRATTVEELNKIAIPERFIEYQRVGISDSVMDHIYDKLMHLRVETPFNYVNKEMEKRHQVLIHFVTEFWVAYERAMTPIIDNVSSDVARNVLAEN